MTTDYYLGIDIGGTKSMATLVRDDGTEIEGGQFVIETKADEGPAKLYQRIVDAARNLFKQLNLPYDCLAGIGVGIASPVIQTGVHPRGFPTTSLLHPTNMPRFEGEDPATALFELFGRSVYVLNDGDAGGMVVYHDHVSKHPEHRSAFYGSSGTGFGTVFIEDGKIARGRSGMTSEGGHPLIYADDLLVLELDHPYALEPPKSERTEYRMENLACLIGLRSWIVPAVAELLPESKLAETFRTEGAAAAAFAVRGLADLGDEVCRAIIKMQLRITARMLVAVDMLRYPDVFLLSGGLYDRVSAPFRQQMEKWLVDQFTAEAHPGGLLPAFAIYPGDAPAARGAALAAWTNLRD